MPLTVAVFIALVAPADSPGRVDDIPVIERPHDHFYGAIAGSKAVKARWQVSPAAVPFGESFTLSLVVSNAVNPHELACPPLLDFAEFRDLFSAVEDVPANLDPSGEVVTFTYRVTPRNEGAFHIPELKYRYYQPLAPTGHRTLTTHATKVPFAVTKPAATPAAPIVAPAEYFLVRTDGTFTRTGGPGGFLWAGLFAAGVLAVAVWVIGWRRLYPDGARLATIRRHRAVRTALDRLRRPKVTPEAIAVTLRNYLIARYGLSFTAQTPAEVAAGLAEVGVPAERAAEAEGVLRACDAARFAPAADTGVSADRVAAMIERWEGVRGRNDE